MNSKGPIPSILVFTSQNQKPISPRTDLHYQTTRVAGSSG